MITKSEFVALVQRMKRNPKRYHFLKTPCQSCGQQMVAARSGGKCINCGLAREVRE